MDTNPQGNVIPAIGGPPLSNTEQASRDALARINAGGSAIPAGGQPAPIAPAGGQPPLAPDPTLAAAPGSPNVPGAPGATQTPPENETPEAKTAREAAEAAAAAAAATGAVDPLRVELPFTLEGSDEPLSLTADSPETAAALQQVIEDAMSGRESAVLLEQASAQLRETEELREYAGVDPIGFTIDMLDRDVEKAELLTKFMLTQPSVFERLKPVLAKLVGATGADEMRALRGDVADQRRTAETAATSALETNRAVRSNVDDIRNSVIAMLPADMSQAQKQIAFRDCIRDLKDYADSKNLLTLPVHQISSLLTDRLTALGIDPAEAASRAAVAAARRGGSTTTGRGAIPAPAARRTAPPAKPVAAQPNGATFVQSATRRASVAAIPSGGAGSPGGASPLAPPRKADGTAMSTAETIQWHRNRLSGGQKSY